MSSDALRAEFEAWLVGDDSFHAAPSAADHYAYSRTQNAWFGYQACAAARADEVQRLREALEHIIRRLQMDIDGGSRPDQWSMEDLVRKANSALTQPTNKEQA